MSKKLYTGINIQWPISRDIISGKKTIETRTYPLPEKYLNEEMVLIETPGKNGKFKARMLAVIKFTKSFKYSSKKVFYEDRSRHLVTENSPWAWNEKPKWGWEIEIIQIFKKSKPLSKRKGIVYTKDINI